MIRFFIDPHGQLPAYAQLKDQIKLARMYEEFGPGDVLPSIRTLARQVGVGDGVVRRAYRELCDVGLLRTDRRKHVVATPALRAAPEGQALTHAGAEQCDRLIAWAGQARLSAIALGRLLLMRALAREAASPSYVFVDVCHQCAEDSARKVSRAWEIKVAGVTMGDFANLSSADIRRLSAVLVNEHLHENVTKVVGGGTPGVFAVRMRVDKRLRQRISKLPARSRVLVVVSDEALPPGDNSLIRECERLFGNKRRLQVKAHREVPDLVTLAKARRYRLILLFPLVWEQMPAKIKRMATTVRVVMEPDPQSLEEVRIAAGILV